MRDGYAPVASGRRAVAPVACLLARPGYPHEQMKWPRPWGLGWRGKGRGRGTNVILTPLSCQDQDMFVAFAAFRPWHGLSCDIFATIIRADSGKFLLLL